MAVPGPIDDEACGGCNALIRDGAVLCRGVDDVLEELDGVSAVATRAKAVPRTPAGPPPGPGRDAAERVGGARRADRGRSTSWRRSSGWRSPALSGVADDAGDEEGGAAVAGESIREMLIRSRSRPRNRRRRTIARPSRAEAPGRTIGLLNRSRTPFPSAPIGGQPMSAGPASFPGGRHSQGESPRGRLHSPLPPALPAGCGRFPSRNRTSTFGPMMWWNRCRGR